MSKKKKMSLEWVHTPLFNGRLSSAAAALPGEALYVSRFKLDLSLFSQSICERILPIYITKKYNDNKAIFVVKKKNSSIT